MAQRTPLIRIIINPSAGTVTPFVPDSDTNILVVGKIPQAGASAATQVVKRVTSVDNTVYGDPTEDDSHLSRALHGVFENAHDTVLVYPYAHDTTIAALPDLLDHAVAANNTGVHPELIIIADDIYADPATSTQTNLGANPVISKLKELTVTLNNVAVVQTPRSVFTEVQPSPPTRKWWVQTASNAPATIPTSATEVTSGTFNLGAVGGSSDVYLFIAQVQTEADLTVIDLGSDGGNDILLVPKQTATATEAGETYELYRTSSAQEVEYLTNLSITLKVAGTVGRRKQRGRHRGRAAHRRSGHSQARLRPRQRA